MLNTYAAVLEAAFPERRMGAFRSTLSRNSVRFATSSSPQFSRTVSPGTSESFSLTVPANTVQASVNIFWGFGANDFGLKVFNAQGNLLGESNGVNLPGFSGRREKVVLANPLAQTLSASVRHTIGVGTSQEVFGSMELTTVQYPILNDLSSLSPAMQSQAQQSLLNSVMLPQGNRFRPTSPVTRADFAETLVRGGGVPQYVAANRMYSDVKDISTRSVVESVQSSPNGRIFVDVNAGSRFYPNESVSRIIAAVAFVRAAGLENSVATATLSPTVIDGLAIPAQLRGYVAVALQYGFLTLDGDRFNQSRSLTRLELALAMNTLVQR